MTLRSLVMSLALGLAASAGAASHDVNVGRETVAIPDPAGLVSLKVPGSPYYKFMANMQQRLGNRLLANYLPGAAAERADGGSMPRVEYWGIAFATPREDMEITNATFRKEILPVVEATVGQALAESSLRNKVNQGIATGVDDVKSEFGMRGKPDMDIGQMGSLGVLARTDDYLVHGATTTAEVTDTSGKRVSLPIVMALAILNVRDRVLMLALYRRMGGEQDTEEVKLRTIEWAQATAAANRR